MATDTFHALLIGAGFAMFGTTEGEYRPSSPMIVLTLGPWNLCKRLEARVGDRLSVDAIIEVDPPRAEAALALKAKGPHAKAYENATILPDIKTFAAKVESGQLVTPTAIFVATPPFFRGGTAPSRDLELQLTKLFPDVPVFLEKPVATGAPWEESVSEANAVAKQLKDNHPGIISIGYVLRYLEASKKIKQIIEENNLTVMATFARWIMAYPPGIKLDWWNKSLSHGPVIEQGTHVVDLSRYFGGDVNFDTLGASAVEWYEKPGHLSQIQIDESKIPEDDRIPRFTAASWKYTNGAVGSFMHGVALQGTNDSIELQVFADGYQFMWVTNIILLIADLSLSDPYGTPELRIRRPGSDESEIIKTEGDDPYQTEMNHFIDAVEGGEPDILSTYEDAAQTYEFTWRIRNAAEANTKKQLEKFPRA